jgi:hypothetical protein
MTETLRVYWDNYDLLVPRDADSGPSTQMQQLIDANVPLYVHPKGPMLVGYVPGKTSVRGDGNHIEDLYFQYQGDSSETLVENFGMLIDQLHQSQDQVDPPRNPAENGVSQAVIDTGIFDEYWHFQNPDTRMFDEHRTPFPLLFRDIDGTLPPLKAVHRRALLNLLETSAETCWLGIEDIATAAEVIAALLEEGIEKPIAVHDRVETNLDPVDVVLVPGNRNFEPLDGRTQSALKESFDDVTENLPEWFTDHILDGIRALLEDKTVPPSTTLRDLKAVKTYIEDGTEGTIRSETGKQIIREYTEMTESTHISDTKINEIREQLLTRLEAANEEVEERIVVTQSEELLAKIRALDDADVTPQEEYAYYRELRDLLDEQNREAVTVDGGSVPGELRQFAETYRSIIAPTGPGEAVTTEIRKRITAELDDQLEDTRRHVVSAVIDEFDRLINNVALPNDDLSAEDRLRALKLASAGLEDRSTLETLAHEYGDSDHVAQLGERLQELTAREAIDSRSAQEVETRIQGLFDQQIDSLINEIQQEFEERLNAAVQQVVQGNTQPREKVTRLDSLKQLLNGEIPPQIGTRPAPVQNTYGTLQRLDAHDGLSDTKKRECRRTVLDTVETAREQVSTQVQTHDSEEYLGELREQLDILAKEQGHAPEYIVDTVDEIERIIDDKEYLDSSVLHHDNKYVRTVASILHNEFEDRVMRDEEKANIQNELQTKRDIYSTDDQQEYSLSQRVLRAIPSVVVWALGIVVVLVVLLMAIFFVLWWTGQLSNPATESAILLFDHGV